jgi:hypothetical protein
VKTKVMMMEWDDWEDDEEQDWEQDEDWDDEDY